MGTHQVISEFIDLASGERISPAAEGDEPVTFTPHDQDQAQRLVAAGCLIKASAGKGAGSKEPDTPVDPLDHDGDGKSGGSQKGEQSTAAKGRARRQAAED